MWNVQMDALFYLPFSDLQSDQYLSSRFEIQPNITPTWPGFHRDSTTIDPIANRRMGDERGHQTAYFTYKLHLDTMSTPILNWRKKCWLLRSVICVETHCNGPVPDQNRTWNQTGNFDPLLTLIRGGSSSKTQRGPMLIVLSDASRQYQPNQIEVSNNIDST